METYSSSVLNLFLKIMFKKFDLCHIIFRTKVNLIPHLLNYFIVQN